MGKEIEKKFLVKNNSYKLNSDGILYRQGYLSSNTDRVVRIRIIKDKGYITIKGSTKNCTRDEYEYEIPYEEANSILDNLCEKPIIEKYRYKTKMGDIIWEVDEFIGINKGLVIAEVELEDENQNFPKPDWIADEVTQDPRYYNSNLVKNPFTAW